MSLDTLKVSLAPDVEFFWKHFDRYHQHEMWASKISRPVFPWLNYQVAGLSPDAMYTVSIHFELTNKQCFQYEDGRYQPVGKAVEHGSSKQIRHEWGVLSGGDWMKRGVLFRSLRITSNFATELESEIPLYSNQKYQPVISIREVPTPGNPNPTAIQCRLKHTEFITVSKIRNDFLRSLKLMDEEGDATRDALWSITRKAPPIFATCTFEKKNLGENDRIRKKVTNKTPSTLKSGSVHSLLVRKLSLPNAKIGTENPKPIEKITPEFESFLRNCPPDLWKRLMTMDAQEAKQFDFSTIPAAILNPGLTHPKKSIKQQQLKQVICVGVPQDGQEGTVTPTPAVKPPLKKRLVKKDRGEPNTKEKEKIVCFEKYNKPHPGVCSNGSLAQSMLHVQIPTSQTHFSAQISPPTFPSNYGRHQTPFPFPLYSQFSPNAGNNSIHMANSMPQLPVAYPQFFSSMSPALNFHSTIPPHPFGPFPHPLNTSFPPPAQPFMFPSQHNQSTSNPRKRSYQKNM